MKRCTVLLIYSLALAACLRGQTTHPPLVITPLTGDLYLYYTYGDPGDGHPYPSNSLYMVTTAGVVLLDVPWDTTQLQPLLDSIYLRHHEKPVLCISTHFHSDRTAGLDILQRKGVATWSSQQTRELCRQKGEQQAAFVFTHDTSFVVGHHTFRTFYPGEGHTKDNIVVWFEKESVLYGGCFVKSTEAQTLGNLADANPDAWSRSIKKVIKAFPHPAFVIPGHLGWADKTSLTHTQKLLDNYLQSHTSHP